jgi:hypothetical protein
MTRYQSPRNTMRPVFTFSVYGHHRIKRACWTSHTAVDRHGLFPGVVHVLWLWIQPGCPSDGRRVLEQPQQRAVEDKRGYQPETREHIR